MSSTIDIIRFDQDAYAEQNVRFICPECGKNMVADVVQPAWTETRHAAMVPLVCSRCEFGTLFTINIQES